MEFGISTTALREHPVAYAFKRIAAAGYAAAEVWPWHLAGTRERPQALAQLAVDLGLRLTLHAYSESYNPLATDPAEAAEARRMLLKDVKLARTLGAEVVTIHPGYRVDENDPLEDAWTRLLAWVSELDRAADELQMPIGLELMENLPLEIFMVPSHAARLMAITWERIGLTVDIAHMNTHGDPAAFLGRLNPDWITHVHLSDNSPARVHLPLGEGEMDLGTILGGVGQVYPGIVSIEGSVPGYGETLLEANRAFLRKLGYS